MYPHWVFIFSILSTTDLILKDILLLSSFDTYKEPIKEYRSNVTDTALRRRAGR